MLNRQKQKATRQFLRQNQTDAESILWQYLRRKEIGIKFVRQHGIANYIVDFCCRSKKLIIEIDGKIHNDKDVRENDQIRTEYLESFGYKVVRFTNYEVLNGFEKVLEKIKILLN